MMNYVKSDQLRWWLIICFQILIFALGMSFGIWHHVWHVDVTKLSFVIMAIWAVTTVMIGIQHFSNDPNDKIPSVGWFLSESCLALGMIGTVAGFLIMLNTSFEAIDVSNTASLQQALAHMAQGMGTALYTTLVGLICSLFIKSQLVNLEQSQ